MYFCIQSGKCLKCKTESEMGACVKNMNNLVRWFGGMDNFATLSLSLSSILASKSQTLNSFTKLLPLFFVQVLVPLSFLIYAFIRPCSYVPCRYVRRSLFISDQILI